VRPPQRGQIAFRNVKLWIEQRAVDIGRQQPDGSLGERHYYNFIIASAAARANAHVGTAALVSLP